jgi:hypothetical protein
MMKTFQLSIKQRTQQMGEKVTRWKDTSYSKLRILQRGWIIRGTRRNQVLEPSPPIVKSILDKEKLLIWRIKNQVGDQGTFQLRIQFASHESKLVPRKLDLGPSTKVEK